MDFWGILSKVADFLQVITAIILLKRFISKYSQHIPKNSLRSFFQQAHDPLFIFLVVSFYILMILQNPSIPPLIAILMTLVAIPLPASITLWYLRRPMKKHKKLQALAFAPIFTVAYYTTILILVCTWSVATNQTISNVFGYLSLPQQVINLLPGMVSCAIFVSLAIPIMWVKFVPKMKTTTYDDILRRLSS